MEMIVRKGDLIYIDGREYEITCYDDQCKEGFIYVDFERVKDLKLADIPEGISLDLREGDGEEYLPYKYDIYIVSRKDFLIEEFIYAKYWRDMVSPDSYMEIMEKFFRCKGLEIKVSDEDIVIVAVISGKTNPNMTIEQLDKEIDKIYDEFYEVIKDIRRKIEETVKKFLEELCEPNIRNKESR